MDAGGLTGTIATAELGWPSRDLTDDMDFLTGLGFRLERIWPADDPAVAVLGGYGVRLRLERGATYAPAPLRLRIDGEARELQAPNGARVIFDPADPPLEIPSTQHCFEVRRLVDSDAWVIGRAGMQYRDLIPDRLGGSIIASHIRIPDGGPVPDMVHYHTIGFQLIFCYRGWVDLVYEDQGDPFRLGAGDCVIQPPQIRHRVLYASDNIEVIEIGVPAEHVTTIDHAMELPNGSGDPDRTWQGTKFRLHREAEAIWTPWRLPGWTARDTGIGVATQGVAGVHVARPGTQVTARHDTDILFSFVMEGGVTLSADGKTYRLTGGDAFTLPPALLVTYAEMTADLELLEVTLPAETATEIA